MKRAICLIFIVLGVSCSGRAQTQSVPFQLHRNYLILTKCSVAGHGGLTAIVDTGTTETILDLVLINRLGLQSWPDSATSLNKDAPARGVRIRDLEWGPVRTPTLDGVAMDLSVISRQLGVHPDVVVGMDVLQKASFTVDYGSKILVFGSPTAFVHAAALAPGLRFALIDSDLLGRKLRLQVDTGFNGMLVYGDRLHGLPLPADAGARVASVAEKSGVRTVDSASVQVGNWHSAHLSIAILDGAPRDFDQFDGLLGPRFLGARRVAFDFEHHMLYWD